MQRLGFIHDMLDVKCLILFAMARVSYPVTLDEIYAICFQDDCLSYFDIHAAVPEMVASSHLEQQEGERFVITEKGRADGALMEDSLAFSVRQRVENAVAAFNRQIRRSTFVKTDIAPRETGDFTVRMTLDDETGNLMTLELMAPNQRQANRLAKLMEKKAEEVYNLTMQDLLDDEDEEDDMG